MLMPIVHSTQLPYSRPNASEAIPLIGAAMKKAKAYFANDAM